MKKQKQVRFETHSLLFFKILFLNVLDVVIVNDATKLARTYELPRMWWVNVKQRWPLPPGYPGSAPRVGGGLLEIAATIQHAVRPVLY